MINPPSKPSADAAQRVLRAAADLFSELGYDAVSVAAIAEQAGVSKANIFHHFKTKQDLFYEVLRSTTQASADILAEIEQANDCPQEKLVAYAEATLRNYLENPRATRLLLRELTNERSEIGGHLVSQDFGHNFERLTALVRSGQHGGLLRGDLDPAAFGLLICAANVFFAQTQNILRRLPAVDFADQPQRYTDMMMDVLLHGAAARNAP